MTGILCDLNSSSIIDTARSLKSTIVNLDKGLTTPNRWWGTPSCSSSVTLLVMMSRPLYTCKIGNKLHQFLEGKDWRFRSVRNLEHKLQKLLKKIWINIKYDNQQTMVHMGHKKYLVDRRNFPNVRRFIYSFWSSPMEVDEVIFYSRYFLVHIQLRASIIRCGGQVDLDDSALVEDPGSWAEMFTNCWHNTHIFSSLCD